MDESEKHLENLVKELKEMSQTKYPSYLPNANTHGGKKWLEMTLKWLKWPKITYFLIAGSSTATSLNGVTTYPDFILEDEVQETSKVLGEASDELKAATNELQTTVTKLQQENEFEMESLSLREAYKALERAQEELEKMRWVSFESFVEFYWVFELLLSYFRVFKNLVEFFWLS